MVLDVSLLALIDVFQFVVRCIDWVIEIHISELASQVPSLTHALDTVAAWLSPVYSYFSEEQLMLQLYACGCCLKFC